MCIACGYTYIIKRASNSQNVKQTRGEHRAKTRYVVNVVYNAFYSGAGFLQPARYFALVSRRLKIFKAANRSTLYDRRAGLGRAAARSAHNCIINENDRPNKLRRLAQITPARLISGWNKRKPTRASGERLSTAGTNVHRCSLVSYGTGRSADIINIKLISGYTEP